MRHLLGMILPLLIYVGSIKLFVNDTDGCEQCGFPLRMRSGIHALTSDQHRTVEAL